MSAKNVRRGLFSDQSATTVAQDRARDRQKQQKGNSTPSELKAEEKEYKSLKGLKKIIPCDTDTDCMRKNGGDGGLD